MSPAARPEAVAPPPLLDRVDLHRIEAARALDPRTRSELGQFLTPPPVASFMASLFERPCEEIRVLDAGAGVGSLLAAFTASACARRIRPSAIRATGFEIDPRLAAYLRRTARACRDECAGAGIDFAARIIEADFIRSAVERLDGGRPRPSKPRSFTHAILNPPYKKLNSDTEARAALRRVGLETSNLYTAFLGLAILLLEPGGELVAITPRSFCNGPYFRPFRELFFREMSLRRVHVFESRKAAFAEDDVLQENVILHAIRGGRRDSVIISSSRGPEGELLSARSVPFEHVVRPGDPELFVHVVPDDAGEKVAATFARMPSRLTDLNVGVSTGKVVDFRAREFLRQEPGSGTGPLIYPTHLASGVVRWPKHGKKPNALVDAPGTAALWMPSGNYVLVKRFSSKEERRRVVAALFTPESAPGDRIGFENHLNVLHRSGKGLPAVMARGLVAFLNSTLVDTHVRQFNGHTQVNATDLRNLRVPTAEQIERLGRRAPDPGLPQDELDRRVDDVLGLANGALQATSDRTKKTE